MSSEIVTNFPFVRSNRQISIYLFLFSRRTYCQLVIISDSKDAIVAMLLKVALKYSLGLLSKVEIHSFLKHFVVVAFLEGAACRN